MCSADEHSLLCEGGLELEASLHMLLALYPDLCPTSTPQLGGVSRVDQGAQDGYTAGEEGSEIRCGDWMR